MDSDRILALIDSVLPFEVCLYYRVIPLKVTPDRVHLGMVEPDDLIALEYLNKLFQHVGRTVMAKTISADAHQFVMSSYLNHTNQRKGEADYTPPSMNWLKSVRDQDNDRSDERNRDPIAHPIAHPNPHLTPDPHPTHTPPSADDDLKLFEIAPEPPHLPVSMLVMLPPDRLLPALLAQVLSSGIGRLFFERREKHGSIVYSQDGVRQSVLDSLPIELFQDTLDRLKLFMDLDGVPRSEASPQAKDQRESDSEFLYRDERVLLRLRVMPGNYGEEATLQVLRGKAMEFYQEQKLEEWRRAAMSSAKLLKFLVRKIRSAYLHRAPRTGHPLTFLPQLEHLLDQLETEMEELSQLPTADSSSRATTTSETSPSVNSANSASPESNPSSTIDTIARRLRR
jgi:type II secretory ATPase GspE/PulE/Tfp pilus assembly ATPase PilB-like protein